MGSFIIGIVLSILANCFRMSGVLLLCVHSSQLSIKISRQ